MIETGAVEILPLGIDDVPRMQELMRKYRDCRWTSPTPLWCAPPSANGCGESLRSTGAIFRFIDPLESAVL